MNYKKIHDALVEKCKKTSPAFRIRERNPNDFRLVEGRIIYTEKHHIIPKHEGGNDSNENLISVLPEEHLMLHLLRWKITNKWPDLLAAKLMSHSKHTTKSYAYIRQTYGEQNKGPNTSNYGRRHSKKTKKALSDFRKGTFYGKCVFTGQKVGIVRTNDPKVLSGEIVHVSKGITNPNKANDQKNESNSRWSGYSDVDILEHAVMVYKRNGNFWSRKKWFDYCDSIIPNIPKYYNQQSRFPGYRGSGTKKFQNALLSYAKKKYNIIIKFTKNKTKEHRQKLSKATASKIWITNTLTGEIRKISSDDYKQFDQSTWTRRRGNV